MRSINLNQLPKYSSWVARLLGLAPFKKQVRNLAKIQEEYDQDKYGKCLLYSYNHPKASIEVIKAFERGREPEDIVCISKGGKLYLTSFANLCQLENVLLLETLTPSVKRSRVIIELGSGYGYNLYLLKKNYPNRIYLGGEFSQRAVKLAKYLFKKNKRIKVLPFNFYDKEWRIFNLIPKGEKAVIFTRHAIEQLPTATPFLKTIKKYKHQVSEVVHLEPIYELHNQTTTLGLLRQSYTLMNDYNIDLLSLFKKNESKIEISKIRNDLLGSNPLNPTSLIHWRFF